MSKRKIGDVYTIDGLTYKVIGECASGPISTLISIGDKIINAELAKEEKEETDEKAEAPKRGRKAKSE